MKKLMLLVIGLLALFTLLRVHALDVKPGQKESGGLRFLIHPGIIEFQAAEEKARIDFGLMEASGEGTRLWNLFPLRLSVTAGGRTFSLALNGLSFLTRGGVSLGRPVLIKGLHSGDLISVGGPVTIEGTVQGDVWSFGADITLAPGATVTGNVVAMGGQIKADRRALIRGNKQALPSVKVPLLGLLSSDHSALTLRFILELFRLFLFLLLLFLFVHFGKKPLSGMCQALGAYWRDNLLYGALALLILPLAVALLVASVVGILILPLLFLLLLILAAAGLLAVSVRLGSWLRKKEDATPLSLYLSGLLGLFILKGPVLLGILLTVLASEALKWIGGALMSLSAVAVALAVFYGLGGSFKYLRLQSQSQAG